MSSETGRAALASDGMDLDCERVSLRTDGWCPMSSESVFISYARDDAAAADSLARGLERAGFSVFVDRQRMRAGSFSQQLDQAIATCDVFLLLISSASVDSMYVNRELHVAADDHQRPLPVVLEEVDVSPFRLAIAGLQRVDYSSGSAQQLADVVDGVYRTAALWRSNRPGEGRRAVRVVGSVVAAAGLLLLLGGMGFFFVLFAQAWNSGPDSQPSSMFPVALMMAFAGMVVAGAGEALRKAGRRGKRPGSS